MIFTLAVHTNVDISLVVAILYGRNRCIISNLDFHTTQLSREPPFINQETVFLKDILFVKIVNTNLLMPILADLRVVIILRTNLLSALEINSS